MAITKESLLKECQDQAALRDQLLAKARELTAQAHACEGARVMAAKLLSHLNEGLPVPVVVSDVPFDEQPKNGKSRVSRKPAEAVA